MALSNLLFSFHGNESMVYELRKRKLKSGHNPSTAATTTVRWEKVLYKRQPFPDNYTDETQFLDQLRTNVGLVHYSLADAVFGACTVMGHLDLVALFLCCFELVQLDFITALGLLWLVLGVSATLLVCLSVAQIAEMRDYNNQEEGAKNGSSHAFWLFAPAELLQHALTLLTILAFGYAFTPVIRTLTTSISTDSIYACAILLFLASLLPHNYGIEGPIVSMSLSVNLCLAASVFLISRLGTDLLAFLLLALSLCLFCFWPQLRNALFARWRVLSLLFLLPLALLSCACLAHLVGSELAFLHFLLHLFVVLFCPWLFIRMQSLKSTIHGPWDEATLRASIEG